MHELCEVQITQDSSPRCACERVLSLLDILNHAESSTFYRATSTLRFVSSLSRKPSEPTNTVLRSSDHFTQLIIIHKHSPIPSRRINVEWLKAAIWLIQIGGILYHPFLHYINNTIRIPFMMLIIGNAIVIPNKYTRLKLGESDATSVSNLHRLELVRCY